jgi:hypothetical protein
VDVLMLDWLDSVLVLDELRLLGELVLLELAELVLERLLRLELLLEDALDRVLVELLLTELSELEELLLSELAELVLLVLSSSGGANETPKNAYAPAAGALAVQASAVVLLDTFSLRAVWKLESVPPLSGPSVPVVQPVDVMGNDRLSLQAPNCMTVRSLPETVTAGKAWLAAVCGPDWVAWSNGLPDSTQPRMTYARAL